MKRIIAVLLTMLLLLAFPACATNETGYKDVPADAWYASTSTSTSLSMAWM